MDEFDLEALARHMGKGATLQHVQAGLKGHDAKYDASAEEILGPAPRTIEGDIAAYKRLCPTGVTAPSILLNIAKTHFKKKPAEILSAP